MRAVRWLLLCTLIAACGEPSSPAEPGLPRSGRFGSLRDLVLFDRSEDEGGPFFLDRFEATNADWGEYRRAVGGRQVTALDDLRATMPHVGLDLPAARAFAAWRFCRVQRADEWAFAASGGGSYRYPWGNVTEYSRCNCYELGIGDLLPVGTFESGRRGQGPYDLIGNAAEWTETVPLVWWVDEELQFPGRPTLDLRRQRTAFWDIWAVPSAPSAREVLLFEWAPRLVAGGDYLTQLRAAEVSHDPRSRLPTVGVRFACDPTGLLAALAMAPAPTGTDEALLLRFLRLPRHHELLVRHWPRAQARLRADGQAPGTLAAILEREL